MVPVLKTPPLCLKVPTIESSPIHVDPTLPVTNISVLKLPESLETVIGVPVRITESQYDITLTVESSHASEELSLDISSHMDAKEHNDKESVILCDFNDQLSDSTQQLGYPYPIITEDNFCGIKHERFSEHCYTTL